MFERYDGGVAEVHGAILDRYDSLKAWDGPLGRPVSDEHAVLDGAGADTGIRSSVFEHGAIYWSVPTGAQELLEP